FFQAEDGIRDDLVTGVQTCALPIWLTVCFSMNSLMSRRTIACSSSNNTSARALHSSVLPTPVGPRKMNEPIGRCGSCNPLRLRRSEERRVGKEGRAGVWAEG